MTKPIFTTKHYKAIAEMFAFNPHMSLSVQEIAHFLRKDNPKFDWKKFIKAVEKEQEKIK